MTVGILGLGLIGGSLARAYAIAGHRVLAAERDESILSFAIGCSTITTPFSFSQKISSKACSRSFQP